MKKITVILMACAGLYACKNGNEFKVVASVEGVADGKQVLVRKLGEDNNFMVLDTLNVASGTFTYKGIAGTPEMHYFFVEDLRGSVPVIIEPGNISVSIYKDSINASAVSGTPYNDDFNSLKAAMKIMGDKNAGLRRKALEASREKDSAAMKELRAAYMTLQQEATDIQKDFAREHPQSYVTAIVLKQLLLTNAPGITTEEIQRLYDSLPETIKATKEAREISQQLYAISRTAVGAVAPDFSAATPEGDTLSLNDVKGKVTLVDFWAGWCKPCRMENPNIVALYNKYRDKGLSIIGVSFDKTAEEWKKAIADDGLEWPQVSHLKYWQDPIAKEYNVRAIPANFILDAEGKIVAKNLTGEALEAKIGALLGL